MNLRFIIRSVFVVGGLLLCGCGSIVVSTKQESLPNPSQPLTGMRYYLPRGRIQVKAKWDKVIPGWEPDATIITEADPEYCYQLERHVNGSFDDQVLIQVNPATGLLEVAQATSADQTINAVSSVAAAVAAAFTFGAELSPVSKGGTRDTKGLTDEQKKEFEIVKREAYQSSFSVLLDPDKALEPVYLASADQVLDQKLYAKFDFALKRLAPDVPQPASKDSAKNANLQGIVVRLSVPYELTITGTYYKVPMLADEQPGTKPEGSRGEPAPQKASGTHEGEPSAPTTAAITHVIMLPDTLQAYVVPLARIPLVTASTKIALKDGILQSIDRSRPSMVAAILGVPKTILNAVMPIPVQINQSQTQNAGSSHK